METALDLTGKRIAALIALGLVAGLFSGLFGVGGGLIVVPALGVLLKIDHKLAVGTSLMAIVPACTVGIISYAVTDSVNWTAGLIVAVGAVVGAQVGAKLLGLISRRTAQWVFIGYIVVVVVQLMILVPDRSADLTITWWSALGLIGLGLVAGLAAGLLGIGGGGIVVPVMMIAFGASDLIAKGTSLVMMLPGVLSGLVGNLRGQRVLVKPGLIIGCSAVATGPLGAWIAHILPPRIATWVFAVYLIVICATMVRQALRTSQSGRAIPER
ncbi:MAG: sulfite exporter TauE/SafE family protein [Propionibacteriaceae bacterium]|jgi:uncharacterized membrane protein YfcA|nr:sulfite exporter TauE/SafE family protein [Propionibacteriaceae bacterium]